MIYLELFGRCGNQLFRYAAARCIQLEFYPDEEIVISFNQISEANKKDSSFCNELSNFCVGEYTVYKKSGKVIFNESNIIQKIIATLYYFRLKTFEPSEMTEQLEYQKKWSRILNRVGMYWYRTGYVELSKSNYKNKFISGSFEAPEYFNKYKQLIQKEFEPKQPRLKKNLKLYSVIDHSNSVCISVRRGDFESNKSYASLHSLCHEQYFLAAIDRIKTKIFNPVFVFFSDDIEWVKNNIKTDTISYYEDGDDPIWEKLRLMSSCKNFILSNSTFSWWAQYLCTYDNKVVVAPSMWFNNNFKSPLIDSKWELIDING